MISKKTTDLSNIDFLAGEVILIDKEVDWTSFDVVKKIRSLFGVKKVGHAGTLDPAATGLLIVCLGKKTKSISSFQELKKTYTGIIMLGKRTESMDGESPVIEEKSIENISKENIENVRKQFLGNTLQIPPMYSALKYKGKALYKYARKGETIEREAREISVYYFNITKLALPEIHFEICVSKGTYVRVIADDFGKKLGCGGYLSSLRRTAIGQYSVEDALLTDELARLRFSVTEK